LTTARDVFFASERTLRAPWRIIAFIVVSAITYFLAAVLAGSVESVAGTFGMRLIVYTAVSTLALLVSTYVCVYWIDGRTWDFVRLGRASAQPSRLVAGTLMGALAIGVPSVLLLVTHELRIEPAPPGSWWDTALRAALLLIPAALTEELLLRGYIFAVLRETIGWRWTLIGTSIVFGLLHTQNPGADAEAITLVIIAGFFLGAIVLVTESLYAAWAAHFAWNWVMAGALHTAVSGAADQLGLVMSNYRVVDAGPDWLTGGAWGPEGGVAAGLGMFAFLFYMVGRHLNQSER